MLLPKNLISPLTCSQHHRFFHLQHYIAFSGLQQRRNIYFICNKNRNADAFMRKSSFSTNSSSNTLVGGGVGGQSSDDFKSVKYWTENKGRVAHLMLNRPERLNAIDHQMPLEIERAIKLANWDDAVKVILVYGAGDVFCSGYDLKLFSEGKRGEMMGNQEMPWCPLVDFK